MKPLGKLRPWGPVEYSRLELKERVRLYYENKFVGAVDKKTKKLLNNCVETKVLDIFSAFTGALARGNYTTCAYIPS